MSFRHAWKTELGGTLQWTTASIIATRWSELASLVRITALTNANTAYEGLVNAPRGKIVNRAALIRELETQTADLVESATDLDDLVAQFDGSEAGRLFIAAWNRARIIVDAGHGPAPPPGPQPPAPPGPA